MMNVKVKTQGTAVKEEQHQELLKVLAKFEQKTRTVAHKEDVTVDEVLNLLTRFDEVVIQLDNWNVLRVAQNYKYYLNNRLCGINPTSDKEGFTYDSHGRKVSVNYSGKQQFKAILESLLK